MKHTIEIESLTTVIIALKWTLDTQILRVAGGDEDRCLEMNLFCKAPIPTGIIIWRGN